MSFSFLVIHCSGGEGGDRRKGLSFCCALMWLSMDADQLNKDGVGGAGRCECYDY